MTSVLINWTAWSVFYIPLLLILWRESRRIDKEIAEAIAITEELKKESAEFDKKLKEKLDKYQNMSNN